MARIWGELVRDSLTRPRVAARRLIDMGITPVALAQLAVVVTCLGLILAFVAMQSSAGTIDAVSARILNAPLLGALVELGVMVVIAVLTYRVGALFGGKGSLEGAAVLVVWLNAMLLLIQTAQIVALVVMPPVATLLAIGGVLWAFWAYANFVTELHDFENPFMVLGGVVLTAIVMFIAVAMLLAILGVTPQEVG